MKIDSDAFTRFRNRGEPTNGQSCSPTKAIMRCSRKFATAYWSTYHQPEIWVKYLKQRSDSNIELQHSDFSLKYSGFGHITKSYYQGWSPIIGERAFDYDDVLQTILG